MPKTLLLADDSVTIQKVVGISFANEDVVLLTVDNGDDAIARAREARPDVVLADVMMPGCDGYDVCEAIKSDPALRHVPVLLLSGTFESYDEERARRVGADGHITKPFEAQALVDTVNELLARGPAAPAAAPTPVPPATPTPVPVAAAPAGDATIVVGVTTETDDAEAFDFFDEELSTTTPAPPAAAPTVLAPADDDLALAAEGFELEAAVEDEGLEGTEGVVEPIAADPLGSGSAGATTVAILDEEPAAPQDRDIDAPLPFFGEDFDEDSLVERAVVPPAAVQLPAHYEESFDFGADAGEAVGAEAAADAPHTVALFELPAEAPSVVDEPAPVAAPPPIPASARIGAADVPAPTSSAPSSDLSESMREHLHATLEKVAWEAFGDLSERIVREALERIEAVAWEVIPQMAEALIREEIRRLKGSD